MRKTLFILLLIFSGALQAQTKDTYELSAGLRFQKTEQLYWENGVGLDYTSDFLLNKRIHLKMSYASSRLGSAMIGNAIRQDNYLLGADWRFMHAKPLQIFVGLNTGLFHADMEESIFSVLPHNTMMFSTETGLCYHFKIPVDVTLSVGYNLINGDGVSKPGTLFPVFYQLSVFYRL
jgi:hypothetical protein